MCGFNVREGRCGVTSCCMARPVRQTLGLSEVCTARTASTVTERKEDKRTQEKRERSDEVRVSDNRREEIRNGRSIMQ